MEILDRNVDSLLARAGALPEDVLRMISQHHEEMWRAVTRQVHDIVVHELHTCQQGARGTYYRELMDTEGGGRTPGSPGLHI